MRKISVRLAIIVVGFALASASYPASIDKGKEKLTISGPAFGQMLFAV
jgi:hypothetical protein